MLSCVISTIIKNYVCIDYLACQTKKLSEITVGSKEGSKHGDRSFNIILGIGIPNLLMNLSSCNIFLKNINSVVISKRPKNILEYYLSKGFTILEFNDNNLAKLPNDIKQIFHAEKTDNSDKVMTCINKITSISNTLKNLVVNKSLHYSYIKKESNDKNEMIINIFSAYIVPLLKDINHPALLQERKLNINDAMFPGDC